MTSFFIIFELLHLSSHLRSLTVEVPPWGTSQLYSSSANTIRRANKNLGSKIIHGPSSSLSAAQLSIHATVHSVILSEVRK